MLNLYIKRTRSKITSEIFIKSIATRYLRIRHEDLAINKNKYGKPFLVNFPNIYYNISHSKGIIVCSISQDDIGIDVERIRTFNKGIPRKFFSKNEQEYILSREENQNSRFFEVWTRKEAYVKWIGKGMDINFQSFDSLNDKRIKTIYVDNFILSICNDKDLMLTELKTKDFIEVPN